MQKRIVIIGAGPTGLGAAYRLQEIGYENWEIYEANNYVGGLSASFKDEAGFTWDIGGHVMFSHYEFFTRLVDKLLKGDYLRHVRRAFIWTENCWVPYPFQDNIASLPKEKIVECIMGVIEAGKNQTQPQNFQDWIIFTFGQEIANSFMIPINEKTWAIPLDQMSQNWIAERIDTVSPRKLIENVVYHKEDVDFGPNKTFIFPKSGGTGGLYNRFIPFIANKLFLNKKLAKIDLETKKLKFEDGKEAVYDVLISTMPLDQLVRIARIKQLYSHADNLKHNGSLIVGIGLHKKVPSNRSWMYFPDRTIPFYRATYLSNYSAENAPQGKYYSIMCETSYSAYREVDKKSVVDETIEGLIKAKLLERKDKKDIVSRYLFDAKYAYPIPTLSRDRDLETIQLFLEKNDIFSRGRFGAWKYEIGNMDHSVMQGVEVVNRLAAERVWNL